MAEFGLLELAVVATLLCHVLTGVCDEEGDVSGHVATGSAEMVVWLGIDVHGVDEMVRFGNDIPNRTADHMTGFSTRNQSQEGKLRVDVHYVARFRHNSFLLVVHNGSKAFAHFADVVLAENAIFFTKQSVFHYIFHAKSSELISTY